MPISEVVGATPQATVTGTNPSFTPNMPANCTDNDLLVLNDWQVGQGSTPPAPATPSGWYLPVGGSVGFGDVRLTTWTRVWEGGLQAPTITSTGPSTTQHRAHITRVRGGSKAANPFAAVNAFSSGSSATLMGPISGRTNLPEEGVLFMTVGRGNDLNDGPAVASPSPFTTLDQFGGVAGENMAGAASYYNLLGVAGTDMTAKSYSISSTGADSFIGRMFIIAAEPAPAGPPPEVVPGTGERVNMLPNPSFETNLNGWSCTQSGQTNPVLSRSIQNGGAASPTPFGEYYAFTDPAPAGNLAVVSDRFTVAAGVQYAANIHLHRSENGDVQFSIDWYNSSGTLISSASSSVQNVPAGFPWYRIGSTGVAPAGTVTARIRLVVGDTAGNGVRVDAALFERGDARLDYFDGSIAPATWTGVAHASPSRFPNPLIWVGDLESGVIGDQFSTGNPGDYESPNENVADNTQSRLGNWCMRSTINATTTQSSSGQQRAERESRNLDEFGPGDKLWFSLSTKLNPGFQINPPGFQLIRQWKNNGGGSPPIALHIEGGRFELQGGFGYPGGARSMPSQDMGPATIDVWTDWLFYIEFEEGPDDGKISIWRDGVQMLNLYVPPGGTLYPGFLNYLKQGLYRAITNTVPVTAYLDEMRVGLTRASVEIPPQADRDNAMFWSMMELFG